MSETQTAKGEAQKLLDHMEQLKNAIHDLSNELQQLKLRINPFIPVATSIYTRPDQHQATYTRLERR